jgi:hypothetical protein
MRRESTSPYTYSAVVAGDVGASMSDKEAQLIHKLTKPDVKVIDADRRRAVTKLVR